MPKYDLFISHATADTAWVNGYLLDALQQAGVNYHTETAFELGKPSYVGCVPRTILINNIQPSGA